MGRPANYPGWTCTHKVSTIYASHHVRRPDAETGCSSHVKRAARVKSSVTALNQSAQIVLRRVLLLDQAISIYYQRMSATSWPMVFACTINYPNVVVLTVSLARESERGHELMTPVTSVSHAVEVTLIWEHLGSQRHLQTGLTHLRPYRTCNMKGASRLATPVKLTTPYHRTGYTSRHYSASSSQKSAIVAMEYLCMSKIFIRQAVHTNFSPITIRWCHTSICRQHPHPSLQVAQTSFETHSA
jgi:hypothetical protein